MNTMFDIDFATSNFQVTNLKYYLDKFKTASNKELRRFKQEITQHGKNNRQHQAFSNIKNYTTHNAIISAINYELLKRSKLYYLYQAAFPFRKWIVSVFSGIELKEHEAFGTLYCHPEYIRSIWHVPHQTLFKKTWSFGCKNWANILISIGTVGAFIVALLTHLKCTK